MRGRRLTATRVLIASAWGIFTILVFTAELPLALMLALIAVSFLALITMLVLFSRWKAAEIERQPVVALTTPPVEPGDTFVFAPMRARIHAAFVPVSVAGTLLFALVGIVGEWLLLVPAAIALAALLWRYLHVRLELGYDGLRVRNPFRSHELRWSDVRHVYIGGDEYGDCIAFSVQDRSLGLEARATVGRTRDRELVHQLRRYAQPHEIEFDPELLRL